MKKYLSTFFILILAYASIARAQETQMPEAAGVESEHIVLKKVDSTGGIQLPSSLYMVDVEYKDSKGNERWHGINEDLNEVRGPDVLGKCGFYRSTLTDPSGKFCQDLYTTFKGTPPTTAAPNTVLPSGSGAIIGTTTAHLYVPYSAHPCAPGTPESTASGGKCSGTCYDNDTFAQTGSWGPGAPKCLQEYYHDHPPANSFCQPYGSDSNCRSGT